MNFPFSFQLGAPSLLLGYVLLGAVILVTLLVSVHQRYPLCVRLLPRRRVISLRSLSSTFSLMTLQL